MAGVDISIVSESAGQITPAPRINPSELIAWVYHPQTMIKVAGPSHQIVTLPEPIKLKALLEMAVEEGYQWALLDGPRAQRAEWLLDMWWEDQPEMPAGLLQKTQARALKLSELGAALEEYIQK